MWKGLELDIPCYQLGVTMTRTNLSLAASKSWCCKLTEMPWAGPVEACWQGKMCHSPSRHFANSSPRRNPLKIVSDVDTNVKMPGKRRATKSWRATHTQSEKATKSKKQQPGQRNNQTNEAEPQTKSEEETTNSTIRPAIGALNCSSDR